MTPLASFPPTEQGVTDQLRANSVTRPSAIGVRLPGALRDFCQSDTTAHCNGALWGVPDGQRARNSQDLGRRSAPCMMDAKPLFSLLFLPCIARPLMVSPKARQPLQHPQNAEPEE